MLAFHNLISHIFQYDIILLSKYFGILEQSVSTVERDVCDTSLSFFIQKFLMAAKPLFSGSSADS